MMQKTLVYILQKQIATLMPLNKLLKRKKIAAFNEKRMYEKSFIIIKNGIMGGQ